MVRPSESDKTQNVQTTITIDDDDDTQILYMVSTPSSLHRTRHPSVSKVAGSKLLSMINGNHVN